jgi:hypothetical protein
VQDDELCRQGFQHVNQRITRHLQSGHPLECQTSNAAGVL